MPRGARRIPAHSPVKVIPWLMVVAPRLCDALAIRLCPGPRNLQQQEWGGVGTTAGLQDKVEKLLRKMGKYNKNRRDNKNIWD